MNEILYSETKDDYVYFLQSVVKRYDPNVTPLIYLANVVEGMHVASSLLKRVSPDAVTRGKDFFGENMVNNHVRLVAFWHVNPRVLNQRLVRFLEEVVENGMDHTLHDMNNLQIIYSVAVGACAIVVSLGVFWLLFGLLTSHRLL